MADYRSWCASCGAETNFGSHKADCEFMEAERKAFREQREFEDALYKEYNGKPAEEVLDEAVELAEKMRVLDMALKAAERKWDFIRYQIVDKHLLEEYKERTGRRYL